MPRRLDDVQFEEFREEALQLAVLQKEYAQLARETYQNGNKMLAKLYSNKAKGIRQQINAATRTASSAIFNHVNENRSENEIDLHGLHVKEAIERLKGKVITARANGILQLNVIVGRGLHSRGGPRIKPAVIAYAKQQKITYTVSDRNPGCVYFHLGEDIELRPRLDFTTINIHPDYPDQPDSEDICNKGKCVRICCGTLVAVTVVGILTMLFTKLFNF